ncbi:MAG: hypothetical protein JHC70_07280 [Rhodococcus sp.]|nr:hypothetical protein [Rhodococcus sp. (in: high G+C Gram-positive bacteria)]MBJ7322127.1 hypothetical protein [Rhodococcus sp. (in: high G+C Gram-positive bacteria)]
MTEAEMWEAMKSPDKYVALHAILQYIATELEDVGHRDGDTSGLIRVALIALDRLEERNAPNPTGKPRNRSDRQAVDKPFGSKHSNRVQSPYGRRKPIKG